MSNILNYTKRTGLANKDVYCITPTKKYTKESSEPGMNPNSLLWRSYQCRRGIHNAALTNATPIKMIVTVSFKLSPEKSNAPGLKSQLW